MDPIVKSHFQSLYDGMLEKNLSRIIEPYSRVEMSHVAKCIQLPNVINFNFNLKFKKCFFFITQKRWFLESSREEIVTNDFGQEN